MRIKFKNLLKTKIALIVINNYQSQELQYKIFWL